MSLEGFIKDAKNCGYDTPNSPTEKKSHHTDRENDLLDALRPFAAIAVQLRHALSYDTPGTGKHLGFKVYGHTIHGLTSDHLVTAVNLVRKFDSEPEPHGDSI